MTETATEQPAAQRLEFRTTTAAETIETGARLVQSLRLPLLLILTGTLGAGKTTLVKGMAEALNAAERDDVTSPTFTLIHEYEGALHGKPAILYHLDLYRLETERQVEQLGIDELLEDNALVLVEWGEKFPSIIRRAGGEIRLDSAGGDARTITLTLR